VQAQTELVNEVFLIDDPEFDSGFFIRTTNQGGTAFITPLKIHFIVDLKGRFFMQILLMQSEA
jgi:hypothetical protein